MVKVVVEVQHIYKYPMEIVAKTHLSKYPNSREPNVVGITEVERSYDAKKQVSYWRRIAHCRNIIPAILCKLDILKIPNIELEEECWMYSQPRKFVLVSRSLTWNNYANIWEESSFKPCSTNPKWTEFKQHGVVEADGLGPLGQILVPFAKHFLTKGAQKAIAIMEEMMYEKYPSITNESAAASSSTFSSSP